MMPDRFPKGVRFSRVPHDLLLDRKLSATAQLLYVHIMCYSGYQEICPSMGTLAKRLGRSKRTAQTACLELLVNGWLKITSRKGRTHVFHPVINPKHVKEAALSNRRFFDLRERRKGRHGNVWLSVGQAKKTSLVCEENFTSMGVKKITPKKETRKDRPKKNCGGSDSTPAAELGSDTNRELHSNSGCSFLPERNWADLIQSTKEILRKETDENIQQFIIDALLVIQSRDFLLKDDMRLCQNLLAASLTSMKDQDTSSSSDQTQDRDSALQRVSDWVEKYFLG